MATSVGGISATFDGDSTGLAKAVDVAIQKLEAAKQKSEQLALALSNASTTSKLSADGLNALKVAAAQAAVEVDKLTGKQKMEAAAATAAAAAAKAAAAAHSSALAQTTASTSVNLKSSLAGIEKLKGMTTGVAAAAGVATGAFGAMGGAITNSLGALAIPGMTLEAKAVIAAIGLIAGALAVAIEHWDLFGTKAKQAATKATEEMDGLKQVLADIADEMNALSTGTSINIIRQTNVIEKEKEKVQESLDAAGGVGGLRAALALRDKGVENPLVGRDEAVDAFIEASKKLSLQQQILAALQGQAAAEAQKAADDKHEAEINSVKSRQLAELNKGDMHSSAQDDADADKAKAKAAKEQDVESKSSQVDAVRDTLSGVSGVSPLSGFNPEIAADAALALVGLSSAADAEAEELDALNERLALAADETGRVTNAHASLEDALFSTAIVVTDLDDPLSVFGEKAREIGDGLIVAASSLGDWVKGLDASDVASGIEMAAKSGFQGVGGAIGAQVGGAIDLAFGGATGGLGTVIGGLIGGILGKALDSLIDALGILTPLFDAIAVVIGALQPVLSVVGELFLALANVILALAPLILLLSKVIGALLLVVVRIVEAILPFLNIVLLFVPALLSFLDLIVAGVSFLDTYFFRPLVEAALWVQNGFIDFLNGITKFIRLIPGLDKFGTLIAHVNTELADTTGGFAGTPMSGLDVTGGGSGLTMDGLLGGSMEVLPTGGEGGDGGVGGSGEAADSYGRELTNVPSGYKGSEAEFSSAAAEGPDRSRRGGHLEAVEGARSWTINIAQWNSRVGADADVGNLRRLAKHGLHVPGSSFSRFNNPDDRN